MNKSELIQKLDDRSLLLDFCLDLSRLATFAIKKDKGNYEVFWDESVIYFNEIIQRIELLKLNVIKKVREIFSHFFNDTFVNWNSALNPDFIEDCFTYSKVIEGVVFAKYQIS